MMIIVNGFKLFIPNLIYYNQPKWKQSYLPIRGMVLFFTQSETWWSPLKLLFENLRLQDRDNKWTRTIRDSWNCCIVNVPRNDNISWGPKFPRGQIMEPAIIPPTCMRLYLVWQCWQGSPLATLITGAHFLQVDCRNPALFTWVTVWDNNDKWMNGWMNEWMDGWMDGWMDEWMNKCLNVWMNPGGLMDDEWMYVWMTLGG